MSYTKGKWFTESEKDGANFEHFVKCNIGDNEKVDICLMLADTELQNPIDNAQLIAAAPELLEACQDLVAQYKMRTDIDDHEKAAIGFGEEAIAKAEKGIGK